MTETIESGQESSAQFGLTTVRQPIAKMIDLTADLTLALARGTASTLGILKLPGELVERSTTKARA